LDGDEFSLLITELAHYHDGARVARRLLDELRKPFSAAGQEIFVSASLGLALYPLDGEDAESLIKNAGAAMHFAKDQGRDNYQFYSRAMNSTALEKLAMESQLRKAVERDELVLYYQPKIISSTGEVVGLEALIRWMHPELGMVPPSSFIPLAEETGLIVPIGEWVLREAARQNTLWQREGLPCVHVGVNIASLHFRQGHLTQHVAHALAGSGLDAGVSRARGHRKHVDAKRPDTYVKDTVEVERHGRAAGDRRFRYRLTHRSLTSSASRSIRSRSTARS
jgi:predicted signal transduction protein with EAL and GGDEF domain